MLPLYGRFLDCHKPSPPCSLLISIKGISGTVETVKASFSHGKHWRFHFFYKSIFLVLRLGKKKSLVLKIIENRNLNTVNCNWVPVSVYFGQSRTSLQVEMDVPYIVLNCNGFWFEHQLLDLSAFTLNDLAHKYILELDLKKTKGTSLDLPRMFSFCVCLKTKSWLVFDAKRNFLK